MSTIFSIEGVTINLVVNENDEEKIFIKEANGYSTLEISEFIKIIKKRMYEKRRRDNVFTRTYDNKMI